MVSRRTIDDKFFAINAGRTNHNGIEVDLDYTFFETDKIKLISVISATKNDFKFKEFVDFDYDYSGNDLTGVPSEVINFGLDIIVDRGLYGNINFQEVARIPANDANTTFSDNYELLYSKIGFKNNFGKYLSYDLFFGMNNMLNTKYASQLQINARGFGSTAPRYFYPGLPFNVYVGININYNVF
ncbi:porin family protein [Confluentibacter flavum]|uniref:Uncharacterized protein n=1 Tax=Confluentibacter flavum TaxID=1909700 RepID=A0A2N3HKG0_9FLAO|nr:hypothetical protein CSW08_08430 [Confluentibacter flavum]